MKILISHVNFPSQFRRLILHWADLGHDIVFLAKRREWHAPSPDGYRVIYYSDPRPDIGPLQHPYLSRFEKAVLEGQCVFRAATKLKISGWVPDLVISHLGFGNGFYLKECFPAARRIGLVEWFYNAYGSDVDFLRPSVTDDHRCRLLTWNAELLLELSTLDRVVVPTLWQHAQFPQFIQTNINVIHEGIDYEVLSSLEPQNRSAILKSLGIPEDAKIVTYVSRCFEEYRGFPQAISALARILASYENVHILLVGSDGTAYGTPRHDGLTWSQWANTEYSLDPSRTHWLGPVDEHKYHQVLVASDVHLYLTVPFILSWSLLESMAAGCSIVASNTQPVLEVLRHSENSLLVDFFDIESIFKSISSLLDDSQLAHRLSVQARHDAATYSITNTHKLWDSLLTDPKTAVRDSS